MKQQVPQYVARNMQHQAAYILGLQVLLTAGIAAACWVFVDRQSALSALLGGLVALLGNTYMLIRSGIQGDAKQLLWAFYRAETGKWLLTFLLFILLFKFAAVTVLFVLLGYLIAQTAFWFALIL